MYGGVFLPPVRKKKSGKGLKSYVGDTKSYVGDNKYYIGDTKS